MFPCQGPWGAAMLCLLPQEARFAEGLAQLQSCFSALTGVVMKFCQVVLMMTLGMTAEMVLERQTVACRHTLPAGTVLVASEALPEAGLFSPDLLGGSGHDALWQGLAMTPEISQATRETARGPARSAADPAGPADPVLERYLCVPGSLCRAFRRRPGRPGAAYAGKMGSGRKRLYPAFCQRIRPAGHPQCHSRGLSRRRPGSIRAIPSASVTARCIAVPTRSR